jgi:glycosyltransferase involved in cell wall biosynthesis
VRLGIKGVDHIASMLGLLRRFRRERPDVIHFQWLPLPLVDRFMLARFRRVAPLVLTVHDTNPFNGAPSTGLQSAGMAQCFSLFDQLIVHTGQGRDRLQAQGIAPERLTLVAHGLLEPLPEALPPDPFDGEVTFLLFGKIKPYKGFDVLIEAFAQLPAELQAQARILVVGKPYMDLAPILERARVLGVAERLTLVPRFVSDTEMTGLFASGTVAVFPYREIEASGVLSLALAHGRPVIASALGNFREVLEDGVQGLLVPPDDVAALSAAMARLLADRAFARRTQWRSRPRAGRISARKRLRFTGMRPNGMALERHRPLVGIPNPRAQRKTRAAG